MTQIPESYAQSVLRRHGMPLLGFGGNPRPEPIQGGPGFFGAISAAFGTGMTAQIYRSATIGRGEFDPTFDFTRLDEDTREDLDDGVWPENQGVLAEAISLEDAYKRKARVLRVQENHAALSQVGGLNSFLAYVAAGVIDPAEIAVFSLTGGSMLARKGLGVGSRLRSLVRGSVAVGIAGSGIEFVAGQDDPSRGGYNMLIAGLMSASIGGPTAVYQRRLTVKARQGRRLLHAALAHDMKRIENAALMDAMVSGGKITQFGEKYFADTVGREANLARIKENLKLIDYGPEDLAQIEKAVAAGDLEDILARMDRSADMEFASLKATSDAEAAVINSKRAGALERVKNIDDQIQSVKTVAAKDVAESGSIGRARDALVNLLASPDGKRAVTQSKVLQRLGIPINTIGERDIGPILAETIESLKKAKNPSKKLIDEAQAAFDNLAPDISRDRPQAILRLKDVAERLVERRISLSKSLRKMGQTSGLDNISALKRTSSSIGAMSGSELRSVLDESLIKLRGVDDELANEAKGVLESGQSLENLMMQREKAIRESGAIRRPPDGPSGPTRALTIEEKNAQSQLQARDVLVELGMTESQADAHLIGDITSITNPPNIVSQFIVKHTTDDGLDVTARFTTKAEADRFAELQKSHGKSVSITEDSVPGFGSSKLAKSVAPEDGAAILPEGKPGAVKAADEIIEPPPAKAGDVDFSNLSPGTALLEKGRVSIGAKITRLARNPEKTPATHLAAQAFFNDPTLRSGEGVSVLGADAAFSSVVRRILQPFFGDISKPRSSWLKKNNRWPFSINARREYGESITDIVERGIKSTDDPDLVAGARAFVKNQAENLAFVQRHGAKPFLLVPQDDLHVPRIWLGSKISKVVERLSRDGGDGVADVEGFFIRAVTEGQPGIDPNRAGYIGRGMFRLIMNTDDLTDIERGMAIAGQRNDLLAAVIRSEVPDITEEQLRAVLGGVKPKGGRDTSILTNRGKRRNVINDQTVYTARDGSTIKLADLTERDAVRLAGLSTRQMAAAGIETKILQEISKRTGQDIKNFQQLRVIAEKEVLRSSGKRAASEVGRLLEIGHRTLRGVPLESDTMMNDVLRAARGAADIVFNGTFGIAAIPETARVLSSGGWMNFLSHLPELGDMLRAVGNGEIRSQVIKELNVIAPMNLNGMTSRLFGMADQSSPILEDSLAKGISGGIDAALRGLSALSNLINLNEPLTMFQKQWVSLLMSQKLFDIAHGKNVLSAPRRRLMGWTEEDSKLVMKNLKAHGKSVDGQYSGKIGGLNLHKWEPKAQVLFTNGIDRESRRAVQTVSVGMLAPWMTHEMYRTIFQYRTYGFVAYENHTLNTFALHDYQAAMETATEGMFVAMAYAAHTHAMAIGMGEKDKKKFLKERMDPVRIASVVFQRSSATSMVPDVVSFAASAFGFENVMDDRISGLNRMQYGVTGALVSNPTFRMIDAAVETSGNLFNAAFTDDKFTRGNFKAATNLIPLKNLLGPSNALNAIGEMLPKKK